MDESTFNRIQNAIEQRREDGYPDDFRIPELFEVTLGDLDALLKEAKRSLQITNENQGEA